MYNHTSHKICVLLPPLAAHPPLKGPSPFLADKHNAILPALGSVCQELHRYTPWKQFRFQTESSFWPLALLLRTSISNMARMTAMIASAYVNLHCFCQRPCHDVAHRTCQKSPQCLKPRKSKRKGVT